MLAEVPRQSINRAIESDERRHPRMIFRQTSLLDLRFELERVREIATRKQMGKTVNDARRKIERFPNLASRAASAITDNIRCHRGAVFAIAAINFLDHCFAAIAARKIQIDVRPAFAALV
jgi:hypothetical protein